MRLSIKLICVGLVVLSGGPRDLLAQDHPAAAAAHALVACDDSPTPGRRPPGMGCAILVHKQFTSQPSSTVVLRLETFPTLKAARAAETPASTVVEAAERVWLLTIGPESDRPGQGTLVTRIGPVSLPHATRYELVVAEANFEPEMSAAVARAVHLHSGPEFFYVISGEQCLETPAGTQYAKAGEGMFAPARTPMQLNIPSTSRRDALFVILHDASEPATTPSDWKPSGRCRIS